MNNKIAIIILFILFQLFFGNFVYSGQDNLPWKIKDGWKKPPLIKIELSWSKNDDPDFESYRLYRSDSPNVDFDDVLVAIIVNQNQISYVDENLDTTKIYYYKLFVFDRAGLYSASNEVSTQ